MDKSICCWTVNLVEMSLLCDYFTVSLMGRVKICLSLPNIQLLTLDKFGFLLKFINNLCFQNLQEFVLAESKHANDRLFLNYGCSTLSS